MLVIGSKYIKAGVTEKRELISYYNNNCVSLVKPSRRYRMKFSDDWCAMFVSVLAHKSGLKSGQFPFEVSVFYMCQLAREWGIYSTKIEAIKEGDLIIYDWLQNGSYDHVGIVSERSGNWLKVLEGNNGDTVAYRLIERTRPIIKGFVNLGTTHAPIGSTRIDALAKRVLAGHFGDGQDRKVLLGDDYTTVQLRVNEIMNG